jgi:hypothetical protein
MRTTERFLIPTLAIIAGAVTIQSAAGGLPFVTDDPERLPERENCFQYRHGY